MKRGRGEVGEGREDGEGREGERKRRERGRKEREGKSLAVLFNETQNRDLFLSFSSFLPLSFLPPSSSSLEQQHIAGQGHLKEPLAMANIPGEPNTIDN